MQTPGYVSQSSQESISQGQVVIKDIEDTFAGEVASTALTSIDWDSTPSASAAHASAPEASEKMTYCWFDCGPAAPIGSFTQSNDRAARKCHPCYNAERAIRSAARAKHAPKGQKAALDKLIKEDPELWKAKVRAVRLDPNGGQGLESKAARRSATYNF